jgi:imidazole glycerol-phosphate synthase subunit HisH
VKTEQNIVVIDYGMGNIGSIRNMLSHLGSRATVTADPAVIEKADKLILPGVGRFDRAMDNIDRLGISDIIRYKATQEKKPLLGICLGMQLLCSFSEEGSKEGLSLVDAKVRKFIFEDEKMKVPHMGWNEVTVSKESRLLGNAEVGSRFYFVHSYFVTCRSSSDVLTYTNYGIPFVSAFENGNIVGVQFHPEKSHRFGINLFRNFLDKY